VGYKISDMAGMKATKLRDYKIELLMIDVTGLITKFFDIWSPKAKPVVDAL
jgi:hypothetical protein